MDSQAFIWDFEHDMSGPAALGRLLEVARGDTGRSRAVARFLLAWWDCEAFGRWTLADLWTLDRAASDDLLSVITCDFRRREHSVLDGFRREFENLATQWRTYPACRA